jgi:hypothetical protein
VTIDTEVRHITKPGTNLFLELGFDATDAAHFHAESQQRISAPRLSKNSLWMNYRIGLQIII